ncbi:hypothetical protein ACO0LF_31810, partial [Undibacterium sp. Di27W]|uniref:hypothetical protein n=1 Tax=Undibacterium sp. Di27W TaxID=3413036 RepID=UPI003BF44F52
AAALAYLKAQASTALADYTQVDNQLTAAKESLKTATASKAAADKAYSDAAELSTAASTAASAATAAIAVDNSLANQQKLNWALNDLREKKSAEATAKQVKDSRDL